MQRYRVLICLLCCNALSVCALSLSDIPVADISSSQFLYFVRDVSKNDTLWQRYCSQWPDRALSRQQAQENQLIALEKLTDRVWSEKGFTLDLAEGIIYLNLFVLGDKNAYKPALSLANALIKEQPASVYGRWFLGELYIQSGQFDKGFAIFDSLYQQGETLPEGFLKSYAFLCSLAYLPAKENLSQSHNAILQIGALRQEYFYLSSSEEQPFSTNWSVNYGGIKNGQSLEYLFEETYYFKPSLRVPRPSIKAPIQSQRFFLPDSLEKDIPTDRYYWHPEHLSEHQANFTVRLNRSPERISAQEELYNLVNMKYDIISPVQLPKSLKGASVRCYVRSGGQTSADLYAITIVDRYTRGNSENFNCLSSQEMGPQKMKMFRYTISLTSKRAVEDKAEFLYRLMLEQFS